MKKELEEILNSILKTEGITEPQAHVDFVADLTRGEFFTNAALVYGKILKINPLDLAEKIVAQINIHLNNSKKDLEFIERVEIAGPGFINFYLTAKSILEILDTDTKHYGLGNNLSGQKIIIEYTQPNPFKELHIGHLVNNAVGEAISRLLETQGAEVKRVTYQGDVGLHVAKSIWAIQNLGLDFTHISDLGKAYAHGDSMYVSDEAAKAEITVLNKKIYEKSDEKVNALYDKGRALSLAHFEVIYKRVGSHFDHNFFESESAPIGKKIVLENIVDMGKGIFKESEGAIIFPEEISLLHTRVFINKEGIPTYEAKDLGLVKLKLDHFKSFDASITITDVEQAPYFAVVMKAMEIVFPDLQGKIAHIAHGRLRLPEGRLSSRTGNIIAGEALINDVQKEVLIKIADRDIPETEKDQVANDVAVAAIKYSILKQSPGKHIIFDYAKAISFEGDSGPYLQYTHARACSLLRKAAEAGIEAKAFADSSETQEVQKHVPDLVKYFLKFPLVLSRAQKESAPQLVVTYLLELGSLFNNFYGNNQIISEDKDLSAYRLSIVQAFVNIMKTGLNTLGIVALERM